MEKLQVFDQNHGLSPLKKCQFCVLSNSMFILSKKACSLTRTSPNSFSRCILDKKKRLKKFQIFDQNHWTTRLEKCQFLGFSNRCFHCPERFISYVKGRRSIFHDLFSGTITWEYRGLQGVTRGYRGLQKVTGGYKGLPGVTKNYRNFFF